MQEAAQDYFIVTRDAYQWSTHVPPFVVGRVAYDNWLLDYAIHHFDSIDVTATVTAIHQVRGSLCAPLSRSAVQCKHATPQAVSPLYALVGSVFLSDVSVGSVCGPLTRGA
jgi:hypothetical protein